MEAAAAYAAAVREYLTAAVLELILIEKTGRPRSSYQEYIESLIYVTIGINH